MNDNIEQKSQLPQDQQKTHARLRIEQAIWQKSDSYFESLFDEKAENSPAKKLRAAFSDTEKGTTQVRNLENIAYTTGKLSDIYDFLKRQMGRPGKLGEQWRNDNVGQDLLTELSGLQKDAQEIKDEVKKKFPLGVGDDTARQIHLRLCQEYIKHVAAHFQYAAKVNL